MKIQFEPNDPAITLQASLIERLVQEQKPAQLHGTLTVSQYWRNLPIDLTLRVHGRGPVSSVIEMRQFYGAEAEQAIRQKLAGLFEVAPRDSFPDKSPGLTWRPSIPQDPAHATHRDPPILRKVERVAGGLPSGGFPLPRRGRGCPAV